MGWRSPEKMERYRDAKRAKRLAHDMEFGFKRPIGPPVMIRRSATREEFLARHRVVNKKWRVKKILAEMAEIRRRKVA